MASRAARASGDGDPRLPRGGPAVTKDEQDRKKPPGGAAQQRRQAFLDKRGLPLDDETEDRSTEDEPEEGASQSEPEDGSNP